MSMYKDLATGENLEAAEPSLSPLQQQPNKRFC